MSCGASAAGELRGDFQLGDGVTVGLHQGFLGRALGAQGPSARHGAPPHRTSLHRESVTRRRRLASRQGKWPEAKPDKDGGGVPVHCCSLRADLEVFGHRQMTRGSYPGITRTVDTS